MGDEGYAPDPTDDRPHEEITPYGTPFYLYAELSKTMPEVSFLIDTGAIVSLLPEIIYRRLPADERPPLTKSDRSVCCGNEQTIRVRGVAFMVITIERLEYQAAFHVTPDVPRGLLGTDFLSRYEGDIQSRRRRLHLNGREIKLYDELGMPLYHNVVSERTVRVPPGTRYVVPGRIKGKGELDDEPFVVEGVNALFEKSGILVAKMITTHHNYRLGIEVHNTTDEPQRINKNTVLGTLAKVKQIFPWSGHVPMASGHEEQLPSDDDMPGLVDVDADDTQWAPALPRLNLSAGCQPADEPPAPTHAYYYDQKGTLHAYPPGIIADTSEQSGDTTRTSRRPASDTGLADCGGDRVYAAVRPHQEDNDEHGDQPVPALVNVYADSGNEEDDDVGDTPSPCTRRGLTVSASGQLVQADGSIAPKPQRVVSRKRRRQATKTAARASRARGADLLDWDQPPLCIYSLFTKPGATADDDDRWEQREGDVWSCQNACYPYGDIPPHSADDLPEHLRDLYTKYVGTIELPWDRFAFLLLLKEYSDAFATSGFDLGRTNLAYHHIDTGDNPPVKQKPRRLPQAQHEEMERQVRQLADAGIIRPSTSSYASNVLLVQKKDGSWRLCIDYRALNANTVNKDPYLIPRIDDTLEALQGARYFCTLDLAQGYHQVELSEDSKRKTAFTTPHMTPSLWEFNCMPFGITGGPGTFQRAMDRLLVGMQFKIALAYLDDVIVYGQRPQQVMDRLARVFDRIRRAGLKLKPKKCTFFERETLYLGHVVSSDGIKCDPAKIEKVREWPRPRNGKECLQFAGFVNYYNRFIPNFSELAQPLYALGPKKVKFEWGAEQEKAFVTLRDALISAPVMAYPQADGDWILDTDASHYAIGAVLSQRQKNDNGELEERVISYGSKSLQGRQQRYCTRRRELLAVVHFVGHFRPYLYGRFVTIRTDHASLRYLKTLNNPDDQFARWMQVLEETYYTIEVRKGTAHGNADAMSRIPVSQCEGKRCICEPVHQFEREEGLQDDYRIQSAAYEEPMEAENPKDDDSDDDVHDHALPPAKRKAAEEASGAPPAKAYVHAFAFTKQWRASDIAEAQKTDADLRLLYKAKHYGVAKPPADEIQAESSETRTYFHDWKRIKLEDNGVLYRQWETADGTELRYQILLPEVYREVMFKNLHDAINAAHMGRRRTLAKLQRKYYWPRMSEDVKSWIQACPTCQRRKALHKHARAPLKSTPAGMPNERVAMDVIDHLPKTLAGNVCVLTIVDHFTKYAKAVALPDQKAATVADALMRWWVSVFGTPYQIHTDQGRNFEAGLVQELCKLLKIHKSRTTPYYPSGNGQCERHNSTIMNLVHTYASNDPHNWDKQLHVVMLGYNSTKHDVTGVEPNKLMLGRNIDMPADLMLDYDPTVMPKAINEYVRDTERSLRMSYQVARRNLAKAATVSKRHYDAKAHMYSYKTGDMVKVRISRRAAGEKFVDKYEGPLYVIDALGQVTYRVAKTRHARERVLHHNKLLPYIGTPEERAMDKQWVFERARELWGQRANCQGTQTELHIHANDSMQDAVHQLSEQLKGDQQSLEITAEPLPVEPLCTLTPEIQATGEPLKVYSTRRLRGAYDPELDAKRRRALLTVWITPYLTDEECDTYWRYMSLSPVWNRNIGIRAVLFDRDEDDPDWGTHSNDPEPLRALAAEMLFYGIIKLRLGDQQFTTVPLCGIPLFEQLHYPKPLTPPPSRKAEGDSRPASWSACQQRGTVIECRTLGTQTDVFINPDMPTEGADMEWNQLSLAISDKAELEIGPENTDYGTCWVCGGADCGPEGTNGLPMGWCRERSRKFIDPPATNSVSQPEQPFLVIPRKFGGRPREETAAQTDVILMPDDDTSELVTQIVHSIHGELMSPALRISQAGEQIGYLDGVQAVDGRDYGCRFSRPSPIRDWRKYQKKDVDTGPRCEPTFLDDIQLCQEDVVVPPTAKPTAMYGPTKRTPTIVRDYDAPEVKYSLRSRDVVQRDKVVRPTPRTTLEKKPVRRSRLPASQEAVLTDNVAQTTLRVNMIRLQPARQTVDSCTGTTDEEPSQ